MFKHLSVSDAKALIVKKEVLIVDIRDQPSFATGHIEGAIWLSNQNLADFISQTNHDTPIIVYCYHGNSSQGSAQLLSEKGFTESYSLDGGHEAWSLAES